MRISFMEEAVKPISPEEAISNHEKNIHPGIITIVNEILSKKYTKGSSVTIKQKEIINEFVIRYPQFGKDRLIEEHHLDFEDMYRKQGWSVVYDRPGYSESYDAFFVFKKA